MKKIAVLLALLLGMSFLSAEEQEAVGDASGSDLDPVLKGFNSAMSGGPFFMIGEAAKYSDTVGSTVKLGFGYDIQIVSAFALGINIDFGVLQLNTDSSRSVSPWLEDYAPVLVGVSLSPSYCINERWEIGLNAGADFMLMAKAKDTSKKENDLFIMIGVGADAEYYTYARHFSFGLAAKFDYIVNFDGFGVTVMPYIKYSFGF